MSKTNKINVAFCVFLVACIVFLSVGPFVLLPLINQNYKYTPDFAKDGVFLELWNVDTFEGGTSSRSKFLEKLAISFEKTHKKQYVVVRNLTIEELKNMLANNKQPDMLSFGRGVGELVRPFCVELKIESDFRKNLQQTGVYKNQNLATPWCLGAYLKCSKTDKTQVFGVGIENNVPPKIDGTKKLYATQYDAYNGFLNDEFDVLLGTQRDYFRLKNKLNLGMLQSCQFEYITEYSDLIQFVSVCTTDSKNEKICADYINWILSANSQKQLKSIGMFSVTNQLIYANTEEEDFEMATKQILEFGNVFLDDAKLKDLQQNI